MTDNKSQIYETWLEKINYALTRFKDAGMDVTKYHERVNSIVSQCLSKNKTTDLYSASSTFSGTIEMPYDEATRELKKVYNELKQHEIYLQAKSLTNSINIFLNSPEHLPENINNYRSLLLKYLDSLKKSQTLPNHLKGDIVDNIYETTYKFILLELTVLNESPTLETLRQDEIHHQKINNQIIANLAEFDLTKPEYQGLLSQKEIIDILGLDADYATSFFLKFLQESTLSLTEQQAKLNTLATNLKKYYEELKINFITLDSNELSYQKKKKFRRKTFNQCWQNMVLGICSTAILLNYSGRLVKSTKSLSKFDAYALEINVYDSLTDSTTPEIKYVPEDTPSSTIYTTHSKWYKSNEDNYWYQLAKNYDLTNLNLTTDQIKNLDITSLNLEETGQIFITKSIEDYQNKEYYTITTTYLNKEDSKEKIDFSELVKYSLLSLFLTIIPLSILSEITKKFNRKLLLSAIKDSIHCYKELRKIASDNKEALLEIMTKIEHQMATNQALITECLEAKDFYASNPSLTKEYATLTKILNDLEKLEKDKNILKKERRI